MMSKTTLRAESPPIDLGGPLDWPFEPFPQSALEGSVSDRFDAIAARLADKLAVQDPDRRLSYGQLAAMAGEIAAAVTAAGRPGPVAILLANEARFPAALFGVLAARRIAVPLDADHPVERNRLIAEHAGVTLVVSAGSLAAQARGLFAADLPVLDIEALDVPAASARAVRPGPEDVAYILYTSGSTGAPKGVFHNHRTALNDTLLATNTLHLSERDRVSLYYSGVIGGIRNILGALLNGASLHILPPRRLQATGIVREIRAQGVTIYQSVPTLFRRVVEALGPGERLDTVRVVRLMGDVVEWSDFDAVRGAFSPSTLFGVAIGSTEVSSNYAQWFVDEGVRSSGSRLPVGRVMPGVDLAVVDAKGRMVEDGEVGEFLVACPHMALGYWREPGLTAERFRERPALPGEVSFPTGDVGLRRPDGLLEFVGRKDAMVKLRGHRIELNEVEVALRACAGVRDAALVVRRRPSGQPRSVAAYVELEEGTTGLLPRHLMAMMSRRLPRYMLPTPIRLVQALPRLPNFKLDRSALDRLDAEPGPPAEPMVATVAAVFERVIDVKGATPDDNLMSLGGDSLQAVSLVLELEQAFDVKLPMSVFQDSPSIRDLAGWISRRVHQPGPSPDTTKPSAADVDALACDVAGALAAGHPIELPERSDAWLQASAMSLIDRGELDIAEPIFRRLHAAGPDAEWPRAICELFDHMPPAEPRDEPFTDQLSEEIQIVRRDSDTVLLAFCGKGGKVGLPLPMMQRWLGRLDASIVYLRDWTRRLYLGGLASIAPDRVSTLEALDELVAELGGRRVLCFGNSAGAFGALDYGLSLGADAVMCVAGLVNLDPDFNAYLRYAPTARKMRAAFPEASLDLREAFVRAPRPPRTFLAYGDSNWDDRLQAEHLAGTSATLVPLPDCERHAIIRPMVQSGLFDRLLRQFTV